VRCGAEDRSLSRRDARGAGGVVAWREEWGERLERLTHRSRRFDNRFRLSWWFAITDAEQKHSLAPLGHAITGGVQHEQLRPIPESTSATLEAPPDVCPAGIDGEGLYVLHHERTRLHVCDEVEEAEDVCTPRIRRVHLPGDREALARRPADDNVSRPRRRPWHFVYRAGNSGLAEERVMGLDGYGIEVVRPNWLEPRSCYSVIEPAAPRIR